MKNFLNKDERESLRAKHSRQRDRRVADRIKAVLLKDEGWTNKLIAKALMLDRESIRRQVQDYLKEKKLKPTNGGSKSKLDDTQSKQLIYHLEANTYTTTKQICFYVKTTFKISFSRQGMNDWLHSHGFSYKKPVTVPAKANLENQKAFISFYKKLTESVGEDESILFMDSVHPTMGTKFAYGWIRKNKSKVIASSGSRTRMNITGAINLKTMSLVEKDYKTINSESTVNFLEEIEDKYPAAPKIHVISDCASYHTSKTVKNFLKTSRVKLHLLPPHSPNLNPIERLWKVMNEFARNNKYFKTTIDFRNSILNFFNVVWPKICHNFTNRINDCFHLLKTAPST